jgi:peptidoglycan/LPS O-acetylase OafA/YrhL
LDAGSYDPRLRGHIRGLDAIRGAAIVAVLAVHFVGNSHNPIGPVERAVVHACTFGMYGVDLFFVLSGFLITGILVDSKPKADYFRGFYKRRALRIFPLYYAVLAVLFGVLPFFVHVPSLVDLDKHQAWAWLYAINIYDTLQHRLAMPYIDQFWSLCVEEHFYFVWPLIVWLCPRKTLERVTLAIALLALAARVAGAATHVSDTALYVLTPFRLDGLGLGAYLAVRARRDREGLVDVGRAAPYLASAGVAVIIATTMVAHRWRATTDVLFAARESAYVLLCAALLIAAVTSPPGAVIRRVFDSATLRFFGKYSYGLYVYHHFISYYLATHDTYDALGAAVGSHPLSVAILTAAGVGVSIAVSLVSFHAFEQPFLRLGRRGQPSVPVKATATPQASG